MNNYVDKWVLVNIHRFLCELANSGNRAREFCDVVLHDLQTNEQMDVCHIFHVLGHEYLLILFFKQKYFVMNNNFVLQ